LTRSKKIATTAVCAAIAIICVVLARFVPVGWIVLYAVSGVATLMSKRLCGYAYALMAYLATSLVSLAVFPYCWPYVMLFGLHAILREAVFGPSPVKTWRRIVGTLGIAAYFYGISLALLALMTEILELGAMVEAVGGVFVLAAIVAAVLVVYDLGVDYLAAILTKAVLRSSKRKPQQKKPMEELPDPFATAPDEATPPAADKTPSDTATPPAADKPAPDEATPPTADKPPSDKVTPPSPSDESKQ